MDEEELKFQRYAWDRMDKALKARSPSVDSVSSGQRSDSFLSPQSFHLWTTDKTLEWLLEQELDALKDLLL